MDRRNFVIGTGTLVGVASFLGFSEVVRATEISHLSVLDKIQEHINKVVQRYTFEFNDDFSRAAMKLEVDLFMNDLKLNKEIYDYLTVCNESNNTPEIISNNGLRIDVFVKQTNSINATWLSAEITSVSLMTV
jgi:hypothetical protein